MHCATGAKAAAKVIAGGATSAPEPHSNKVQLLCAILLQSGGTLRVGTALSARRGGQTTDALFVNEAL